MVNATQPSDLPPGGRVSIERVTPHREYLKTGTLPSDQKTTRDWRTRPDPFEADWPVVEVIG